MNDTYSGNEIVDWEIEHGDPATMITVIRCKATVILFPNQTTDWLLLRASKDITISCHD